MEALFQGSTGCSVSASPLIRGSGDQLLWRTYHSALLAQLWCLYNSRDKHTQTCPSGSFCVPLEVWDWVFRVLWELRLVLSGKHKVHCNSTLAKHHYKMPKHDPKDKSRSSRIECSYWDSFSLILTGWRVGCGETWWGLTRASVGSCTWGGTAPHTSTRMGAHLLGRSSVGKDLGVLWGDKLTMSLQSPCGQKSQWYPGVHGEECGQQDE